VGTTRLRPRRNIVPKTLTPNIKMCLKATCVVVVWCSLTTPAFAQTQPDSPQAAPALTPVQREVERVSLSGSAGAARRQPGSAAFVGPDALLHRSQTYIDPARVLRWLPGLYAFSPDGRGVRPSFGMRGVTPGLGGWMTTLEDGVLAGPAPYAAPEMLLFPSLGRMESVESLGGPGAIRHGPHSSGGTLNLTSFGAPDDLVGRAVLGAGSDGSGTVRVHYGDSWQNASWFLGTEQSHSDGFKKLDGGGETGFDSEDYLFKLRLRSGLDAERYQEVLFKFGYQQNTARDTRLGLSDDDFETTPYRRYAASSQDRLKDEYSQILLRHFIAIDDAVDVTTSVYRNDLRHDATLLETVDGTRTREVLADPDTYADAFTVLKGDSASADDALVTAASRHDLAAVGIQSTVAIGVDATGGHHQIGTGARFHKDEDDVMRRHDGYRMDADGMMVQSSTGPEGGDGAADNHVDRAYALAAFLQDRFATGAWRLTPGVRVEWVRTKRTAYPAPEDADRSGTPVIEEITHTVVLPGVGASYRMSPELLALAGIHTGFQPARPGVDTGPARSIHYEAGLRTDRDQAHAALLAFATQHRDLPSYPADSMVVATGKSRAWGVQLSAGWGIHTREYDVEISGGYTYTNATFETDYTPAWNVDALWGDRVPYIPEHVATASLVMTTRRSWAGIYLDYASRMPTSPVAGELVDVNSTDARLLVDIVTEFEIIRHARIFAGVYNVGDSVWLVARQPAGAFPGAPQMFSAGLKFEL
jgi:Fe(3+) dicitrate transport protein